MSSTWREQEGRTPFKQNETSRARFEERQPSNCDQLENEGKKESLARSRAKHKMFALFFKI